MTCPKCESIAVVAEGPRIYRRKHGDPIEEVRVYVCRNWECLYSFMYRNTFVKEMERRDAAKFLKAYEKQLEKQRSGQEELFEKEED